MFTLEQERDAYQWAASKQCILYERLSYILKDIIRENKIELTKDQIKKINAYDTGNIRAWEHRDEMWLKEFPNEQFFRMCLEDATDNCLVYF